ncbi:MAG: hypothetical protein GY768_07535, partial [Planctomycetaceae bacterium]|nr:hypothetical protein [Planctomycetaceae bacterium]
SQPEIPDAAAVATAASSIADWMCELSWCELSLQQGPEVDLRWLNRTQSPRRASERGLLPLALDDYLAMLDWTGRQVHGDQRGSIPEHLAPILDRLGINREMWTDLTTQFDRYFGRIVGRAANVATRAAEAGRRFYHGQATCAQCHLL